ncbi:MAG: hypothetical protein R2932_52305 [Caldilineaceae bacterium]
MVTPFACRGWAERRVELLAIFAEQVYGKTPTQLVPLRFEITDHDTNTLNGVATRKQVTIYFSNDNAGPQLELLLYTPNNAAATGAHLSRPQFWWQPDDSQRPRHSYHPKLGAAQPGAGVVDNRATAASRGAAACVGRWNRF